MRHLAVLAALGASCGSDPHYIDIGPDDGNIAIDAAEPDAPRNQGSCPRITLTEGPCDPLTQDPCRVGERCTWIWDSLNDPTTELAEPNVGHLGCACAGSLEIGDPCARSGPPFATDPPTPGTGAGVADECPRGAYCGGGVCEAICDVAGGAPSCGDHRICNRYPGIFLSMGATIAGLCDPTCDPLTQLTDADLAPACESVDPASPDRGCFRTSPNAQEFACVRIPLEAKGRVDHAPAYGPESGGAYTSGCEAGYLPFWVDADDVLLINCHGICAPADVDSTVPALAAGDPSVPVKLHDQSMPRAGDGLCVAGKKGSGTPEDCRYFWTNNRDAENNVIDSPFNDLVGVCYPYSQFRYDHDANPSTPMIARPSCADLPPAGGDPTSTIHGYTADAAGCYSWARTRSLPLLRTIDSNEGRAKTAAHVLR